MHNFGSFVFYDKQDRHLPVDSASGVGVLSSKVADFLADY
jgi:hypothetical protein